MRLYRVTRGFLPDTDFVALRDALLSSPLVGGTTLNGPFQATRGFAITFTAAGLDTLLERHPTLRTYLPRVLGLPGARALTPFWQRRPPRVPNAWYLNLLVVSEGGAVGRHVDATLRKPSGVPDAVPEQVTVLYLRAPPGDGGQLALYLGGEPLHTVTPADDTLVHFRGALAHEVRPFSGAPGTRVSLVLEQYHFEADALARLPAFHLDSRAGFAAHLAAHASRKAETPATEGAQSEGTRLG